MCSKYTNHAWLYCQRNCACVRACVCVGGGEGGYLIFMRIFALTTKEIFIRALEIMRNTVAAAI